MRFLLSLLVALIVALGGVMLLAFISARADPIVRRADVALPGWPAGAAPVRVVLVSDVHIGSAAMTPDRLTRIVGQINALSPDLVVLAGDFVQHRRHHAAGTAPGCPEVDQHQLVVGDG